jgi:phospholipid-translocating ATPase
MVLINSSEEEGGLYVETKNLDGETNLKTKNVVKDLQQETAQKNYKLGRFKPVIECDVPNTLIYTFNGSISFVDSKGTNHRLSLSNDCVALRVMSLRNTGHVHGVVIYTGKETKI